MPDDLSEFEAEFRRLLGEVALTTSSASATSGTFGPKDVVDEIVSKGCAMTSALKVQIDIKSNEILLTNVDPGDPRIAELRERFSAQFGVTFSDIMTGRKDYPRCWRLTFQPRLTVARLFDARDFGLAYDFPHVPTPPVLSWDEVLEQTARESATRIAADVDARFLADLEDSLDAEVASWPRPAPPLTEDEMVQILAKAQPPQQDALKRIFAELRRLREEAGRDGGMTMDTEKKRTMLFEISRAQKTEETMRRVFLVMGENVVPMLYPTDGQKAFQALKLYVDTVDKRLPALLATIVETRLGLYTDEEVQAMWDFFLSPMGKVISEKGLQDQVKTEALGREWSEEMMREFQERVEKIDEMP